MRKYLPFLFLIGIVVLPKKGIADSPLTSITLSLAYNDEPIMREAVKADSVLNKKLIKYLLDEHNPIDLKMAVINRLGWDFYGKNNATIFFDYLKKKKKYESEDDFRIYASGDELLCMAYLKAMDNYFRVDDAIEYANLALEKNKKSYTYNIINAIVRAQKVMQKSFCDTYKLTNEVRQDKSLKQDMKNEAKVLIFEYMDLYKDYCRGKY